MSGKKRDALQETIAFIKEMEIEQPLQYVNFRDWVRATRPECTDAYLRKVVRYLEIGGGPGLRYE